MSRFDPEPEVTELERALAALSPSRGAFDRDRLMFEAGRRSVAGNRRFRWGWPAVAAALAAVVAGQTLVLSRRPEPRIVERLVFAPGRLDQETRPIRPEAVLPGRRPEERRPPDDRPAMDAQLALRRRIERFGLEGLPALQPVLTFSAGDDVPDAPAEVPQSFRPHDLEKTLAAGGPS